MVSEILKKTKGCRSGGSRHGIIPASPPAKLILNQNNIEISSFLRPSG
jgi:hypothetical protein